MPVMLHQDDAAWSACAFDGMAANRSVCVSVEAVNNTEGTCIIVDGNVLQTKDVERSPILLQLCDMVGETVLALPGAAFDDWLHYDSSKIYTIEELTSIIQVLLLPESDLKCLHLSASFSFSFINQGCDLHSKKEPILMRHVPDSITGVHIPWR
jgi:hypothetical protein